MLNEYLSKVFLLAISLALFLDAINVDAIFSSHAMIREEYEGESSEIYSSRVQEQINFHAQSCSTGDRAYQPTDKSSKPIYIIDEDSYSLAAKPIIIDEGFLSLWTKPSTTQTTSRTHLFNFSFLHKLQI